MTEILRQNLTDITAQAEVHAAQHNELSRRVIDLELAGDAASLAYGSGTATSGTKTISFTSGKEKHYALTLDSSVTLSFNGTVAETPSILTLKVIQGTGGDYLITWPVAVKWADGVPPTLSTEVGEIDRIIISYDGIGFYGDVIGYRYS